MEELQKATTSTTEQDKAAEAMELFSHVNPKLMPVLFGYLHYLAEQDKRDAVRELCRSGAIHNANDTMKLLSHQPLELDKFNEVVPDILQAFREELTTANFQLYVSVYLAGVMDGVGRERKRRKHKAAPSSISNTVTNKEVRS